MTITVNGRKLALLAVAALALLAAYLIGSSRPSVATASASQAVAAVPASPTTTAGVTVAGSGTVTGTPDTLRLSLSVTTAAPTIDAALASSNKAAAAVAASLKKNGVADKDLQTSGLSIQPSYTSKGAPSGYRVYENLTASLRDLRTAGVTIGAAVGAGGSAVRVDGLSIALDNTSGLVSGARTRAIDDAKTKATQYAEAAGRSLGPVVSISETVQQPATYPYAARGLDVAMAQAAVPIQAGSQDVTVLVTVVYAFA